MGKRGPAPAPTALKLVRGERKDRVNGAVPVPPDGEVVAPGWLSPEALEVWGEILPIVTGMRVMTVADVEALARWCDAVVLRRQATAMVAEEGAVVHEPITAGGEVVGTRAKKNPWVQVLKDAEAQVASIGARFGLTPSDRSQLKTESPSGQQSPQRGADLLS